MRGHLQKSSKEEQANFATIYVQLCIWWFRLEPKTRAAADPHELFADSCPFCGTKSKEELKA